MGRDRLLTDATGVSAIDLESTAMLVRIDNRYFRIEPGGRHTTVYETNANGDTIGFVINQSDSVVDGNDMLGALFYIAVHVDQGVQLGKIKVFGSIAMAGVEESLRGFGMEPEGGKFAA